MNRSAKEETRSSPHYEGEGILVHSSHQGVCGRHGMEDSGVTSGELVESTRVSNPISASEMGSDTSPVVGRPNST
jgi:hypothetical protein